MLIATHCQIPSAMFRFLKHLTIFLILLWAVFTPLDFLLSRRARESSHPGTEALYNILYKQIDADIVIIGSSRAKTQVDPDILDSVLGTNTYNIGLTGTRIDLQTAAYDLYRSHNKRPDFIIHCIDLFSLIPNYEVSGRSNYFPFFWDRKFRKKIFPFINFKLSERFIPLIRYYSSELEQMLRRYPKSLRKGYYPIDAEWKSLEIKPTTFTKGKSFQDIFENYVERVSEEGTQMVFVLPPLYHEKTESLTNLDEMLDYYTSVGERYGIPLLNYLFLDISKDSANFFNYNHLNMSGARAFSDTLAHDLIGITGKL